MFKSFSGTLVGGSFELTGTNPAVGWIYFNDSNVETHELTMTDPVSGTSVVLVGPREIQKIQTADNVIQIGGTGAYRALCFQGLTAFRLFSVSAQPIGTFTAEYLTDEQTIEAATGIQPVPVLRLKDQGIDVQHLSPALISALPTIIEDGGTLEGSYGGLVICVGDATIEDDVAINGDLIQSWNSSSTPTITNGGKYDLSVAGSMHVYNYDATPDSPGGSPNGDLFVYGNLTFANMTIPSTDSPSSVYVGGNMSGNAGGPIHSELHLHGLDDTHGTQLTVYGNLTCGPVDLQGGDSDSGNAGNGSQVIVYGDVVLASWLNISGGDAGAGGSAGDGGNLLVYGDLIIDQYLAAQGGAGSTHGSGGNGAHVEVYGDLLVSGADGNRSIDMGGGDCSSTDPDHRAGSGGSLEVSGDLSAYDRVFLAGGFRDGALTGSLTGSPADGGDVTVHGDLTATRVVLSGGNVDTTAFGGPAGDGGALRPRGAVHATHITSDGGLGSGDDCSGGSGGIVGEDASPHNFCPALFVSRSITVSGGNGNLGGGAGGVIYASCIQGGSGGPGDDLMIRARGGNAAGGDAGDGGVVTVLGPVITQELLVTGGGCTSVTETHHAGVGGTVSVQSLLLGGLDGIAEVDGGDRSGTTTMPATNTAPDAGSITVWGDLVLRGNTSNVSLNGGDVTTDFDNGPAGAGGTLIVHGSFLADVLSESRCLGGDHSTGGDGGDGGTMQFYGPVRIATLTASGGDSATGDAGNPGSIVCAGGCVCDAVTLQDGAGTSPAGTATELVLGGACFIKEIDVTDRVGAAKILGAPGGATLKVGALTDKDTLDNTGVPTASQATPEENLYLYDDATGWYAVTGTPI